MQFSKRSRSFRQWAVKQLAPSSVPASRKARLTAGFSLVDVLGGLSVLAITILAAYQSQISSAAVTRSSRELSTATADLEGAMEWLLAFPAGEIPIAGSEFEDGKQVARLTDLHLRDERLVATYPGYTLGGPIPNQLVIVLTLTWTDAKGRARQIRARTVKLR